MRTAAIVFTVTSSLRCGQFPDTLVFLWSFEVQIVIGWISDHIKLDMLTISYAEHELTVKTTIYLANSQIIARCISISIHHFFIRKSST